MLLLQKVKTRLKTAARTALVPVIYRFPPAGLKPDRLAIYLKALIDRAHLPGDVAEIGCNLGGTSILASRALKLSGWKGTYACFDTFGGFVKEQFEADLARGTFAERRHGFSANSMSLVRKILDYHGCKDVRLVQGDIATVPDSNLSSVYSAALIDVDLAIPTYEALKRVYPRLTEGGIIYVDDCPEDENWKAREGYERFIRDFNLPAEYDHGLGVVRKGTLQPERQGIAL